MRVRRILLIASLLATGLALAGCESFDPGSWFDSKKPLPGERKAMFPSGVPGVPQGVPQELVKGYQPPVAEIPPEVANQEPPKPRFVPPERKPAPKPRQAAAPRPAQDPAQQQAPAQSAPPQAAPQAAPWPSQPQRSSQGSPFPEPQPIQR